MKRKILILVMAALLAVSIPVFGDEAVSTVDPGIKPDSPLYILDRLVEKIQIAIITDAVKEAEALAVMAQERLAESKAMAEENNVLKATTALNEYNELMNQAIDVIDAAAKDGKTVNVAIDKMIKYDINNDELLEKLMDKVPSEYKEELKKAIEALNQEETPKPEDIKEAEEKIKKLSSVSAILSEKIEDKALLEKIEKAGLNDRQLAAIVSMSDQSGKTLEEVMELFIANEKGIGKTLMELKLTPKAAMKDINKTFKEVKKEVKAGLVITEEANKESLEQDETADIEKDIKDSAKLEKKLDKAVEKLEKKIEQNEEKLEKKTEQAEKKQEKNGKDNDKK